MGRIQEGLLGQYSSLPNILRTSALASHLEVTVKQTHSLTVTNSSQFTQDFLDFYDWISSVLRIHHSSRKIQMVGPSECPKKAVWRISELIYCVSFLGLLEQIPPTEWLKTTQNYSHSSEGCTSKSPKPRCLQQDQFLPGAVRRTVPGLCPHFRWFAVSLWCSLVYRDITLTSAFIFMWHCPHAWVCVWISPLWNYTGLGAHHTPVWPHLTLINYICSDPISK